jgi:UDP-N-acetylmuramate dehydrogenase
VKPQIPADFQARVRYDEPMSAHSSWRAGGTADVFFTPHDVADLAALLRALPADVPVYWVGLGSNLLVREGGIRGVVIATPGAFTRIDRRSQTRIYCEASVPCARIARACAKWGLAQGEFFGGIPGTLGGALAMNAGAYGEETWNHVVSVDTIDRRGRRRTRQAQEYQVGYRQVAAPAAASAQDASAQDGGAQDGGAQEWFLAAELQFEPRGAEHAASMRALAERRAETQPLGQWSCGSVFKNPSGDHAARLIEAAGLKGYRIGDAVVSEKHANFIINEGHASATDLERLVLHVRASVQRLFGVALEPEVRIIGEDEPPGLAVAGTGG